MITARFIGTTSQGFIHGQTYVIYTRCNKYLISGKEQSCLCVYDTDSSAWCPYSSLETMLANWMILNTNTSNSVLKRIRKCYITKNKVKVMWTPSILCGSLDTLFKNDECIIEEEQGDWFRITHNAPDRKVKGWINKKYVTTYQVKV